jgi:hypothetical protein
MAQGRPLTTGPVPTGRKPSRDCTDASRLKADVAEALFEVQRLEAIVEDLAVVVCRVGRATGGMSDIEDRLEHLERTFSA